MQKNHLQINQLKLQLLLNAMKSLEVNIILIKNKIKLVKESESFKYIQVPLMFMIIGKQFFFASYIGIPNLFKIPCVIFSMQFNAFILILTIMFLSIC